MTQLGEVEDEIFKKRQQNELNFKAREKAKRRRSEGFNQDRPNWSLVKGTQFAPTVSYIKVLKYFHILAIFFHSFVVLKQP